ncbi:MAG: type III-B CRISPR module RAMP protein Cmr4 [Campylobacterota bacterium]|nr:type III-B CRISPR module RAMP protein Cmr4 [Campylobacterota bacterium]
MKTELYTIETLSNLHVGAGDINFDVIDNQVQRDAITNLPNINSSSLKGAFREHFTQYDSDGKKLDDTLMVKYIFGGANDDENSHATGAYSFFEAQLLTRPVRSDAKPYFNATSPSVIKSLLDTIENFDIEFNKELTQALTNLSKLNPQKNNPIIFEDIPKTRLEDDPAKYQNFDVSKLTEFLGVDLALFADSDFAELDLPVLARNALENGVSQNLWYEEVVPKKSKFFFCIGKPNIDNTDPKDYDQKIKGFENRFGTEGHKVQLGANKSIGYGFSLVKKVSL